MYQLALFPLHTVLFPGMPIRLNIFEDRYREMIDICLKKDDPFGVALIRKGREAFDPFVEPHLVGCTARIVHSEITKDGHLNIVGIGDERFRILKLDYSQPYLVGLVESLPLASAQNLGTIRHIDRFRSLVKHYLSLVSRLTPKAPALSHLQLPEDTLLALYFSASLLQLPAIEKQPLLSAGSSHDLLDLLYRIYQREISVLSHLSGVSNKEAERAAWLN